MSGILLLTSLLVTGCSLTATPEIELPSISLGETSTPSPSPTPETTPEPSKSDAAEGTSKPQAHSTKESEEQEDEISDGFAELEIEDQSGSGLSIDIEEVRLSLGKGILVIFDPKGQVLGSAQVTVKTQPVAVQLVSPIRKNQKLVAQLFLDNGNGAFDADLDTPILDHDGDLARESFDYKLSQD
jgi:hypothetical protein